MKKDKNSLKNMLNTINQQNMLYCICFKVNDIKEVQSANKKGFIIT